MFRLHSTVRTALLRSPRSLCWNRLFHTTPNGRSSSNKFQKLSELPETDEELRRSLQKAYHGGGKRHQSDNKRVNVISKALCEDILDRMKPSLLKHTGCDIIDVNPGAGIWSSAVHNLLKPRNHYLLEPDHELYRPLLQPLLDEEGSTYKFIPKSGVVWGHLNSILNAENLPQQVELKEGDPRRDQPNDTLLFMANLGWFPRKPFRGFQSISLLVVHQLLTAARAHSLFHRYGLIRMLIWVADEEGKAILPRTINLRRKMAIETDISCSNVFEIASSNSENVRWRREEQYNIESSRAVLKRMEDAGIATPNGRAGPYQLEAFKAPEARPLEDDLFIRRDFYAELEGLEKRLVGKLGKKSEKDLQTPEYKRLMHLRNYKARLVKEGKTTSRRLTAELEELESKFASGELTKYGDKLPEVGITPEQKQVKYLRSRVVSAHRRTERHMPLFLQIDALTELQKKIHTLDGAEAEETKRQIAELTAEFQFGVENLTRYDQETFYLQLDSRRTFKNDPPLLTWDRREVEPLTVKANEFYPKAELSLLDFHPQPIWPVLRKDFPAAYDIFEFILSTLFITPTQSVRRGLTSLAPGAFEWLIEECPSITDIRKHGDPNVDLMTVRCLTSEMFEEIMEAWMRWPFRPSRHELLSRIGSTVHDPDDELPSEM